MKLKVGDKFLFYNNNNVVVEQFVFDNCEAHVDKYGFLHRLYKPAYSNHDPIFIAFYLDGRVITEKNIKNESVKYLLKKIKIKSP